MSIPIVRPDIGFSNKSNVVEVMIYSETRNIMIEHLDLLRDEASVRSTIDNWTGHQFIKILMLVVDMSNSKSLDRVNFVRCCVDQHQIQEGKALVMILHYPPSAFLAKSFYLAIFLDGWKHTYLDHVGNASESPLDMKCLIEKVCRVQAQDNKREDIYRMAESIMIETIKRAASHNIFYPGQVPDNARFHEKNIVLNTILSCDLGQTSIREYICRQFTELWDNRNLSKILRRASGSLANGGSQLSLTSCLKGILQDTMGTFLLYYISYLNEWENVDLLTTCRSDETDELFDHMLQFIPVLPFDELVLVDGDNEKTRRDLPQISDLQATFPFFSLISASLDKVVICALPNDCSETSQDANLCKSPHDILEQAMSALKGSHNIALMTIEHVERQCSTKSTSLYDRYLNQFITWKLCLPIDSIPAKWFRDVLYRHDYNGSNQHCTSLLWVHVCARVYEMELIRVSSSMNDMPFFTISQEERNISESGLDFTSNGLLQDYIDWFIQNHNHRWTTFFETFWKRFSDILGDECVTSDETAHQLRILSFICVLGKHSKVSHDTSQMLKGFETTMVSLTQYIDNSDDDADTKALCIEKLIEHFFSSQWLSNIGLNWDLDLAFLVNYLIPRDSYDQLVRFIRNACIFGAIFERKNSSGKRVLDGALHMSISRLLVIDKLLECDGLSRFAADGKRLLPSFIPRFAVDTTSVETVPKEDCFTNNGFAQVVHHNSKADILCLLTSDAEYETEATLDNYFYHDNTPPFLALRFIQRLSISNPTPRYIKTVATAFKNGQYNANGVTFGTGNYGDLAAFFAAIYLDREARTVVLDVDPSHGALREPILKVMNVLKSMEFFSKYPVIRLWGMRQDIGQMAHEFESVFSFFLPEFQPYGRVGDASLVAPEGTLLDMPRIVGLLNGLTSLVRHGLTNCNGGFGTTWSCQTYLPSEHGNLQYNRTSSDIAFSHETFEGPSLAGGLDNEWVGRQYNAYGGYVVVDPKDSTNHVFQPQTWYHGNFFSLLATRSGNTVVQFQYHGTHDRAGGCIGYSAGDQLAQLTDMTWMYCDAYTGWAQNDMVSNDSWISCQFEIPNDVSDFRITVADRINGGEAYFDNIVVTSGTGNQCGVNIGSLVPSGKTGYSAAVVDDLATLLTAGRLSSSTRAIVREAYDNAGSSNDGLKLAQQLILTTAEFHSTNPVSSIDQSRDVVSFPPPSNKPYKAVVYLMLSGGADSYNMLAPHTCTKVPGKDVYDQYQQVRQQVAIMKQDLRPIDAENQVCERFGIHPDLPEMERLYNEENLLFFANTGVLTMPVDKSNYWLLTETQLFAHNHMQREAKRVDPYNTVSGTGVLGRMADHLTNNGRTVGSFSVDRFSVALVGKPGISAAPMIVNRNGVPDVYLDSRTEELLPKIHNASASDSGFFAETWSDQLMSSLGINDVLSAELQGIETMTEFPTSYLSQQLATVSRLIATREARGVDTDTFYVETGGYDTHSMVEENLRNLFTDLNEGLGAFSDELKAMGMWNNVTLVQTSDFARTLQPNSGDGTDHAWGGNSIMMGGAVKGGQILGDYPDDITDEGPLTLSRGRMIPTSPWDGVFRGIASWLGIPDSAMSDIFPNLDNFDEDDLFDPDDMFAEVAPPPPTSSPTTQPPSKPPSSPPSAEIQPSNKPSTSPTESTDAPTRSPTNSPTRSGQTGSPTLSKSPTAAPTGLPTFTPVCFDDDSYLFEGADGKGCAWAANRSDQRCRKRDSTKDGKFVFEMCRKTCGKCACKNDDWFLLGKVNRGCDWAAKNPDSRCSKPGVSDFCPEACGLPCCKDDPDYLHNNNAKRDCAWFAKNPTQRCTVNAFANVPCPEACGKCPA